MFTFIRWLVNTIFFDIKDIESDKKEGVKTFAAYWGKKKTIFFLQAVNLISIVPLVLGVLNNHLPVIVLFLGAAILFGSFYLTWALYLNKRNLRTLSYIIVDSEYLLWPIMLLAGKLFI